MNPICYVAPQSKLRRAYRGINQSPYYVSGNSPEPVKEWSKSLEPGQLHVELFNGEVLSVPTGKGFILSVHEVETPAILTR